MKTITLITHAECFANQAGTLAGYTDSPLTLKGNF